MKLFNSASVGLIYFMTIPLTSKSMIGLSCNKKILIGPIKCSNVTNSNYNRPIIQYISMLDLGWQNMIGLEAHDRHMCYQYLLSVNTRIYALKIS